MFFSELLAALILAVLIGLFVYFLFGRSGAWGGLWLFWLVLFLGVWAFGALMEPVGPILWGVAWMPFLFAALVFALLLASLPPYPRDIVVAEGARAPAAPALGFVFWILVVVLLFLVVFAYWA